MRFSVLVLTAFFVFGCRGQAAGGKSADVPDSANAPQGAVQEPIKAPDFTLTDLQGKPLKLSAYRGKVVFIDFWATWCPPCMISMPYVQKMEHDYDGKKVEFLGLSLDQSKEPVERFVKAHNLTNRIAVVGDSGVDEKYRINGIPLFVIVDKDGNLSGIWEGFNPAMPGQWRQELDRLLGA